MRSLGSSRRRSTPLEILIHLLMAPVSSGTFSWQPAPDMMKRLADDLRWIVLRKVFTDLNGRTPYRAYIQKHAIRVESLDNAFFADVLEVLRDRHGRDFKLSEAREMDELEILEAWFIPTILEWAENERSTSVSRERTPSIEELIIHEDSSGNIYQRFPDDFAWVISKGSPAFDPEPARELPDEMCEFVRHIASELTSALRNIYENEKLEKYLLLMSRLEDSVCTWEMTFDYLNSLGMKRYSSWKSLSVVANRALKQFVDKLPEDVKVALHQDDPDLTREERHERLRMAVSAALELDPLPTPLEIMASAGG